MNDIATLHEEIGEGMSVSWGTMLERDLIEAFLPYVKQYLPDKVGVINEGYTWLDMLSNDADLTEDDYSNLSWYINEDLWDLMDSLSPDGMYFGAHPGDGSDYGWWFPEDPSPDGQYW